MTIAISIVLIVVGAFIFTQSRSADQLVPIVVMTCGAVVLLLRLMGVLG
jgi:hypothetical protein